MTLVVAHRGASAQAPENTMEAFRLGVEAGADAIELDVHLSQDGQLAVIHDDTVDRTTDGVGAVAGFSMDGLRRFDAGARFTNAAGATHFAGKGLRIPTLPEVLDWLPDGVGLVVEIKARAAVPAVIEALRGQPYARPSAPASSRSTRPPSTRRMPWIRSCRPATCWCRANRWSPPCAGQSSMGTRPCTRGRATWGLTPRPRSRRRWPMAGNSAATW